MNIRIFTVLAINFFMHSFTSAAEIDVSNVIRRPSCLIEVTVKLVETKLRPTPSSQESISGRYPVDVRVNLNNAQVELPAGFSEIFWNASRVIPLRNESSCGFQVERGDASTSNRLAVYFSGKKIKKIERFDLQGRVVTTTNFNYPGPVILN